MNPWFGDGRMEEEREFQIVGAAILNDWEPKDVLECTS